MNITDDRQEASDVMEAAKVLGQVGLNESAANTNLGALKENLGEVSRLALAKAALANLNSHRRSSWVRITSLHTTALVNVLNPSLVKEKVLTGFRIRSPP